MKVVFVMCLLLLVSFSQAEVTKTNIGNFLRCLRDRTSAEYPITDALYTPNNSTFASSYVSYTKNKRYSNPNDTNLIAIVAAKHESHVQATVVCARFNRIQIRIRSGGHDYEGLSYISSVPFTVLDMHNLRSISIDVSRKKAWVQAGATMGELYTKIAKASKTLAFAGGVCPTLGAGGHISGGGYGNLMRKYGNSVDHVVDAQLVDVNGKILNRASMGEDLFWAIRGGGGASFGVILSWKINLVEVPKTLTVFKVNKTIEQGATDVLYKWQLVSSKLPRELFMRAMHQLTKGAKSELGLKREDCYCGYMGSLVIWA